MIDRDPGRISQSSQHDGRRAGVPKIALAHGGGGQLTDELLNGLVLPRLGNEILGELLDSAILQAGSQKLAMTIDAYVVQPVEFPGGDIGRLAVSGTVNDLAVSGATPLGIALSLILEEGLDGALLERILDSAGATAREVGVNVVTGDTKVVGHGQADKLYLITAGVGLAGGARLHPDQVRPGDRVLINGPIGDHGLAVMLAREMPDVQSTIRSDVAPLNGLIGQLRRDVPAVAFLRDATRGGLACVAADLASRTGLHIRLDEDQIPVRPETLHAAEMLGLDVLEIANEGKVVAVVHAGDAEKALESMRRHPLGRDARVIGEVEEDADGLCDIRTPLGGRRVLQKPYGEQLPRIC